MTIVITLQPFVRFTCFNLSLIGLDALYHSLVAWILFSPTHMLIFPDAKHKLNLYCANRFEVFPVRNTERIASH